MTKLEQDHVCASRAQKRCPAEVARGGGTISASKAFVLALRHSLHHELASKGVRVQAVLPGATATEFWDIAGLPAHNLPAEIVMSAEDMVDAALVGLDHGELVTIPGRHDGDEWTYFEAAPYRSGSAIPFRRPDTRLA